MAPPSEVFGRRPISGWTGMVKRCTNKRSKDWPNYGGRGIVVSDEWRSSFATFLGDMGEPPADHSLERKDNDGPYAKENCVWASRERQNRNTRRNHVIVYGDRAQTLTEWARELGLSHTTILRRLRRGWSIERALSRGSDVV